MKLKHKGLTLIELIVVVAISGRARCDALTQVRRFAERRQPHGGLGIDVGPESIDRRLQDFEDRTTPATGTRSWTAPGRHLWAGGNAAARKPRVSIRNCGSELRRRTS